MDVLIVEECEDLSNLWQKSLIRVGAKVWCAHSVSDAFSRIQSHRYDVIILDLICDAINTMGIADLAAYRSPKSQVVFVTNTSFFSDGSIFNLCANAAGIVQSHTPPEDLAAMVQHYAANSPKASRLCGAQ